MLINKMFHQREVTLEEQRFTFNDFWHAKYEIYKVNITSHRKSEIHVIDVVLDVVSDRVLLLLPVFFRLSSLDVFYRKISWSLFFPLLSLKVIRKEKPHIMHMLPKQFVFLGVRTSLGWAWAAIFDKLKRVESWVKVSRNQFNDRAPVHWQAFQA